MKIEVRGVKKSMNRITLFGIVSFLLSMVISLSVYKYSGNSEPMWIIYVGFVSAIGAIIIIRSLMLDWTKNIIEQVNERLESAEKR